MERRDQVFALGSTEIQAGFAPVQFQPCWRGNGVGHNPQHGALSFSGAVVLLQEHLNLCRGSTAQVQLGEHQNTTASSKIPALREPGGLILILLPPPAWRISCFPRRRNGLSPERCEGAGEISCKRDPALESSTGSVWCHSLDGNGRSQGSKRSRHWREGGTHRARRELVHCIQLTQSPY